jgi:hypothetical protein
MARMKINPAKKPIARKSISTVGINSLSCANQYPCIRKKTKNTMGITLLLMQYFKKGNWVAAKKVKCLLKRINVVIFQHIIKTPIDMPINPVLIAFTLPKYSGARNKALAPNVFIKTPLTTLKRITQNKSSTWYFLK